MKKLAIVFACWALTLGFAASASAASTKWVDQAGGNDGNDVIKAAVVAADDQVVRNFNVRKINVVEEPSHGDEASTS